MKHLRATTLMGFDGKSRRSMTAEEKETLDLVSGSFREFLRYWQFRNGRPARCIP